MKFLRNAGFWAMLGYGYWAVEEKDGALVGEAGLGEFKRDMTPLIESTPEAGWVFAVDAQGKGYATETVKAIASWADENLEAPQTTCIIEPGHKASIRVAEKCGYALQGPAQYHGEDIIIMTRPRQGNA